MRPRIAIPVPHSEREYAQRAFLQYEQAVRQAGGEPVPIPLEWSNQEIAQAAKRCDGILLPGSKADIDPEKYGAAAHDPHTAPSDPARDNVTNCCSRTRSTCASRFSASATDCRR
jgi:putative glutamine amidotransferase